MKNTVEFVHVTVCEEALFVVDGYRAHTGFISAANRSYIKRLISGLDCAKDHIVIDYPDVYGNRNTRSINL